MSQPGSFGASGSRGGQAIDDDTLNTIQPGVFLGKGFGDLPDSLAWLRPFAVTGAFVDELPLGTTVAALAPNATTGKLQSIFVPSVETLHWGISLQYSTYYLTSRFTGGPPKEEPLNQLLPLVEFSFDSPRGQNTAATMNPGFAYVAVAWQIAAEMIVPLNRKGGSGMGFRAQLLFFLDDLIPSLFGKPLLTDKPERCALARAAARLPMLPSGEADRLAEAVKRALPELLKLDRYERRAAGLRQRSLCALNKSASTP